MSTFSENAPLACLFRGNLNGLLSLWDMQFAAIQILDAMQIIAKLEMMDVCIGKSLPSPTFYETAAKQFDSLAETLDVLGLKPQAKTATGFSAFMKTHHTAPHRESLSRLVALIHHDLESFVFEAVPRSRADYCQSPALFGNEVHDKFSSAAFDIKEAGTCFALGRWTASVFHLMRVLEVGLGALAKAFSVPSEHTNWDTIINQIEREISAIDKRPDRAPNWKDDREFYSQCASHFRVLKDAWRNYTAHARGKYDEGEAYDIFINVKGFLQKLAARLHD